MIQGTSGYPYNLNNLIGDPLYADKIKELRKALNQHIINIHDKSEIPEAQMIELIWPRGAQPKTALPFISIKDETVRISCDTKGASIGYILSEKELIPDLNSGWKVYKNPMKVNGKKNLYVISTRIGFTDSEIASIKILPK